MTLEQLQGQIKKIDEYNYVSSVIKLMHGKDAESTKSLVSSLVPKQQDYLKEIMQSKRVTVQHKGERTTVARRIVKPKRHIAGPSNEMH